MCLLLFHTAGSVNHAASKPDVQLHNLALHGGWECSQICTIFVYLLCLLAFFMPTARALANHKNVLRPVFPPSLKSFRSGLTKAQLVALDNFLNALFGVGTPYFKIGGELRPLLDVCAASFLRFYDPMIEPPATADEVASTAAAAATTAAPSTADIELLTAAAKSAAEALAVAAASATEALSGGVTPPTATAVPASGGSTGGKKKPVAVTKSATVSAIDRRRGEIQRRLAKINKVLPGYNTSFFKTKS